MTKLTARKMACVIFLLCAATMISASAQNVTTLLNFNGSNGSSPFDTALIQGTDGNFYGATSAGGIYGFGTIFKIAPEGVLTTLHNFDSTDGAVPFAGVVLGTDGDLYGVTGLGGTANQGTVFKISRSGTFTTLHNFLGYPNDGGSPVGDLVEAPDGQFWGTTAIGGTSRACGKYGCGTVFKITPSGTLATVHNFDKGDGQNPDAALLLGTDGNFYGSTALSQNSPLGIIFKITPRGRLTILNSDFGSRYAKLVQATDGNFYGIGEGAYYNGSIFRLTPAGVVTVLYNFCPSFPCADGWDPNELIQATDGYLYGTTDQGGSSSLDFGTIFRISLDGAFTTLYGFNIDVGGGDPSGPLFQATTGDFYGTAYAYGTYGDGTIFHYSNGLGPFVAFVRNPAKAGQRFGILGQALTGTTSVSLGGEPAAFSVKSDTLIVATVPADATTGPVTVTTPSGTLTSNVPFHVIP